MNITVVTCAGDRPEAFALCEKYIARQTLKPFQMIVLDDGQVPLTPTLGQEYFHWADVRGRASLVRKLRRIMTEKMVKGDALVFWEDDDWYSPDYLEWVAKGLAGYSIWGEGRALYYTVRGRYWFEHVNLTHASLCATAIRKDAYAWLLHQCTVSEEPFLDVRLWNRTPFTTKVIDPFRNPQRKRRSVGIKAMPGRQGYGGGHRGRDRSAKDDPDMRELISLIGDDAQAYAPFYDPASVEKKIEINGFTTPSVPIAVGQRLSAREAHQQFLASKKQFNKS